MFGFRRAVGTAAAIAAAVASIGLATPPPAHAEQVTYVNLGDSYSAGSGVMPVVMDKPMQCAQSSNNFAHRLARKNGYDLTDVSCGGASTDDFFSSQFAGVAPQLKALSGDVDLVTFSIGGNDGNVFAETVKACVTAGVGAGMRGAPCAAKHGSEFVTEVRTQTYPKLVRAMSAVRDAAPNARVLALNYPWIAADRNETCPGMPIAAGDGEYLHGVQAALNDAVARAAAKTGVTLVDVASASVGHEACRPAGVRWIDPLISTVPVHPNALGERQMAVVTARTLLQR